MEDNESDNNKKSWLHDNLLSIPCMRNTLIAGISGCMFSGLGYFLFTSNVQKSYSVTKKSFFGIGLLYWCYCRYNYTQAKLAKLQLRQVFTPPDDPEFQKKAVMDIQEIRRNYGAPKS